MYEALVAQGMARSSAASHSRLAASGHGKSCGMLLMLCWLGEDELERSIPGILAVTHAAIVAHYVHHLSRDHFIIHI